jgi:hypothetical protein
MQSAGQTKKAAAARPLLRIVNMQKRLRPVYPGVGATDFAIELRNLLVLDPENGSVVHADCGKFRDIITNCIQLRCGISSTLAGKVDAGACGAAWPAHPANQ